VSVDIAHASAWDDEQERRSRLLLPPRRKQSQAPRSEGRRLAPHQTRQRPDLLLKALLRAFYPLCRSRADASTWPSAPWSWRSTCHPQTRQGPGGRAACAVAPASRPEQARPRATLERSHWGGMRARGARRPLLTVPARRRWSFAATNQSGVGRSSAPTSAPTFGRRSNVLQRPETRSSARAHVQRSRRNTWYSGKKRYAPGRIRTCDQRLRRPPLYPAELRARSPDRSAALASPALAEGGTRRVEIAWPVPQSVPGRRRAVVLAAPPAGARHGLAPGRQPDRRRHRPAPRGTRPCSTTCWRGRC
jgi:hypothetical protein